MMPALLWLKGREDALLWPEGCWKDGFGELASVGLSIDVMK